MTRPRHAMRPHPLRSPGVIVGVPVAAAVAFGAHAVLGVVPVADQGTPAPSGAPSTAPAAASPVQGYGLAAAPPPTTLGLLSAPGTDHPSTSGSGSSTVPIAASSAAHHAGASAQTVPIARAAPGPSMMTFSPARAAPAAAVPAAPAAAPVGPSAAAPVAAAPAPAAPQAVQRAAAPAAPAPDSGGSSDQGSSGGSLADIDLGVAKVSLLSFGG